jgi:hypothetical protein
MEMLERCPGCSLTREAKSAKVQSGLESRPCANCGYDGPFPAPERGAARAAPHRDSMPSFAGARAQLATATQDLFRLSGNNSIPVEAPAPAPPSAPPEPSFDSGGRKESSIMFSLEELMKANAPASKRESPPEEASDQLWNMQAAMPLFGTDHDQALLTTPLKMEPAPSMESMTLPSHSPTSRRWWPLAAAAGAGLALAAGGVWFFRTPQGAASAGAAAPSSEQAALAAQPPAAQLPPVDEPVAPKAQAPAEPAAAGAEPGPAAGEPSTAAVDPTPPADAPAAALAKPELAKPARKVPPRAVSSSPKAAFDKNAAKSALNAAASQAAACRQGGPAGKGKIQITFASSGKVSDASLVDGPFGGTATGKCALRHFRAARVPAFAGAPVTVAKSFKVD